MQQLDKNKPWWKHGYVWFVLSGPIIVVIAALVTAVIAIRGQDPVIAEDYYKQGLEINKTLAEQRRQMMPALNARNHVATPDDALPDSQKNQQPLSKTP